MTAPGALTAQDVTAVRAETGEGKQVAVWFTAAAVGVPAGGSAKVLAVGDVAEGDFIQVRPGGSKDTMYCSPNELTRTRPPRRRAGEKEAAPVRRPAAPRAQVAPPPAAEPPVAAPSARPSARRPADPSVGESVAPAPTIPPVRAAAPRRRVQRHGEISVSLASGADGEWTVEVLAGTKRIVPRTPVPAADVAAAARSLPSAVVEAIELSLDAARQRQRDRVEQLRAELDAAQRALEQLGS